MVGQQIGTAQLRPRAVSSSAVGEKSSSILGYDLQQGPRGPKLFACVGVVGVDQDQEGLRTELLQRLLLKMLLQASQKSE